MDRSLAVSMDSRSRKTVVITSIVLLLAGITEIALPQVMPIAVAFYCRLAAACRRHHRFLYHLARLPRPLCYLAQSLCTHDCWLAHPSAPGSRYGGTRIAEGAVFYA
jgi:hypothetical protein